MYVFICMYVYINIHIQIYAILPIESRALCMLGKHWTTELHLQPFIHLVFILRHGPDKLPRLALNL